MSKKIFLINFFIFVVISLFSSGVIFQASNQRGILRGDESIPIVIIVGVIIFSILSIIAVFTSNFKSRWFIVHYILNYLASVPLLYSAYLTLPLESHLKSAGSSPFGYGFGMIVLWALAGILAIISFISLLIGIFISPRNIRTKWFYFCFLFLLFGPIVIYLALALL